MTQLKVRSGDPAVDGTVLSVTPESAGWKHVGFKVVRLRTGQTYSGGDAGREACLVLVYGRADICAGRARFAAVGGRSNPFENRSPGAVYVPAGASYSITATADVELAICSAPAQGRGEVRLIEPSEMTCEVRGSGSNTRLVRNILPDTMPAESLLVVEVITPPGNWSSYPPHKHDTPIPGQETALEETYYHRLNPPQGFAFQRVYTDDRSLDETLTVEDGDVVLVPRGYHPVGTPHGYELYYLNVMAGPQRNWLFVNDPAHEWLVKRA